MIEQRGDATDLLDLSEALLTPGIAGQRLVIEQLPTATGAKTHEPDE